MSSDKLLSHDIPLSLFINDMPLSLFINDMPLSLFRNDKGMSFDTPMSLFHLEMISN